MLNLTKNFHQPEDNRDSYLSDMVENWIRKQDMVDMNYQNLRRVVAYNLDMEEDNHQETHESNFCFYFVALDMDLPFLSV